MNVRTEEKKKEICSILFNVLLINFVCPCGYYDDGDIIKAAMFVFVFAKRVYQQFINY